LRGLAAILVVAQHLLHFLSRDGQTWAGAVITTVDLGKFGVALFFLISGFVIPFSLRGSLISFFIGRAARLLPALWLSILFCLALGAPLHGGMHLFANAFMLTHLLRQPNISDPYWTLDWELYFYGIAAAAFAAGLIKRPSAFGLLALGFVSLSVWEPRFTYFIFMFTGALLRMVLLERDPAAKGWLFVSVGTLAGACCLWAFRADHPPEFYRGLALALPTFLIFRERLMNPALLWLGSISYSLYLFHLPIIETLAHANLPPLVFIALAITMPLVVAAAVYRFVEQPMHAHGKELARKVLADSSPFAAIWRRRASAGR